MATHAQQATACTPRQKTAQRPEARSELERMAHARPCGACASRLPPQSTCIMRARARARCARGCMGVQGAGRGERRHKHGPPCASLQIRNRSKENTVDAGERWFRCSATAATSIHARPACHCQNTLSGHEQFPLSTPLLDSDLTRRIKRHYVLRGSACPAAGVDGCVLPLLPLGDTKGWRTGVVHAQTDKGCVCVCPPGITLKSQNAHVSTLQQQQHTRTHAARLPPRPHPAYTLLRTRPCTAG